MIQFLTSVLSVIIVINVVEGLKVSDKIDLNTEVNPGIETVISPSFVSCADCVDCPDCNFSNIKEGKKTTRTNFQSDEIFSKEKTPKPKYPQHKPDTGCSNKDITIVNNIRIVLDGNESHITPINQPNCQNNICGVFVTTKKDQQGNFVTTVQLSIITKIKDIKVNNIPVIDGVRGLSPSDLSKSGYPRSKSYKPQIYPQNINSQPSPGVPKTYFSRPHTDYSYNRGISIEESHGRSPWMTGRLTIDDKIEPPLSKTTMDEQQ